MKVEEEEEEEEEEPEKEETHAGSRKFSRHAGEKTGNRRMEKNNVSLCHEALGGENVGKIIMLFIIQNNEKEEKNDDIAYNNGMAT